MSVKKDPVGKLRIEGKNIFKKLTNAQLYNLRILSISFYM
jgi:hypothetical protein